MVLFEVIKSVYGPEPTIELVANVCAVVFQVAFGQSFGRFNERPADRV